MIESAARRDAFWEGVRTILPLLLGIVPFGVIVGVTAAGGAIGGLLGYLTSPIIFAGAAQLATIQLINGGSTAIVVIATALVINSRHLMYSAAIAPSFADFSRRSRLAMPYLLTDQAFIVSITRWRTMTEPDQRRSFFMGAALALWVPWQISTAAGVIVGAQIPASWSLDFAIPLVFMGLLFASVSNRPGAVAAVVGGVVAVLSADLHWNLGLIVGTVAGIVAGVVAERVR